MDGLRLQAPYAVSPCTGESRWRKLSGKCSAATNLESGTQATIVKALSFSNSVKNANQFVRDIKLSGKCVTTNTIGAKVNVGGVCWQHVHPHTLDVFDFTSWAVNHPGNQVARLVRRPTLIAPVCALFSFQP